MDMCIDMCMDMCMDMCIDMCMSMCIVMHHAGLECSRRGDRNSSTIMWARMPACISVHRCVHVPVTMPAPSICV